MMRENFELRIREFEKLKKGWHFGEGQEFASEYVELAVQLANRYFKKYGFSVSGAPCQDGSIDLIFNKIDHFLDVKILPSKPEAVIRYCKGIGKNRVEEMWGVTDISNLDFMLETFSNVSNS